MKILGLTDSNASGGNGRVPEGQLRDRVVEGPLSEALGEEIEIISEVAWPNPDLPEVAARWIKRHDPDVVIITTNSFAYQYRSAPIKLERKYGRPGRALAELGLRMAGTRWLAHNPAFQWTRKQIQRRVGGATHFEPEEVAAVYIDVARAALRHEGVTVGIIGPLTVPRRWANTDAELAEAEVRRSLFHRTLKAFCEERHVWYAGNDTPIESTTDPSHLQGDELHANAAGHNRHAEMGLPMLVELCRIAQEARSDQRAPSPS
jgi:hypothetical protein